MPEYYHTLTHKSTHGYVYIIKSDSGHYKIGKSKRPNERVGHFTLQLPFKVEIVHIIECDDYTRSEQQLHLLCSAYHVNGEWFALPEPCVQFLTENFSVIDRKELEELMEVTQDKDCAWAMVHVAGGHEAVKEYIARTTGTTAMEVPA